MHVVALKPLYTFGQPARRAINTVVFASPRLRREICWPDCASEACRSLFSRLPTLQQGLGERNLGKQRLRGMIVDLAIAKHVPHGCAPGLDAGEAQRRLSNEKGRPERRPFL
jgi:hypothetical protein